MKVIDHVSQASSRLVSFEILPPTKGSSIQSIFDTLDSLMEFQPPYINITYHQPETVFISREDGLLKRKVVQKRPGTVAISAAIMNRYQVDVVPHLICGGFAQDETEDALIDLHYLGIDNILVVRGDGDPILKRFQPMSDGHEYALGLLNQVMALNRGKYLDPEIQNATSTDFCVGVAAYPEKHMEAPNFDSDIRYLKAKVDAGAEYVVTQMFFDNQKYFRFVERCRDAGITVPIIPGLKPVSIIKHLSLLPKTFNVCLPDDLVNEMEKCQNNDQVRQVGVEWAIQQSKELYASGVPAIHFFTMGKSDNIRKIAEQIL